MLAETRARVDVPLIPMTYASIFDAYGWERLEADARSAGATSFIVPDLPADVRPGDAARAARRRRRRPTSGCALAADATDGWLYLVTVTGTTGARAELAPTLAPLAARARAVTTCRCTPASASRRRSRRARPPSSSTAIVVGSRAVEAAEQGAAELARFVGSLRAALDA